ncbi:MAG: DUF4167 domain-containing protein [Rhodobacteraceae bacterium]|nr:DUF4167 domain-containing protein [Paracoccaceae bacterium]
MRSSSRPRVRTKNNRNRSNPGNVINRVFDSSGPEGKVRGTPQQVIDKYQILAHDMQISGDRVAAENFLQHAEHYVRMLGDAQREMDARREQQEQHRQPGNEGGGTWRDRGAAHSGAGEQPDTPDRAALCPSGDAPQPHLVDTPESGDEPAKRPQGKPAHDGLAKIQAKATE